jgi:hypothetical protein
MSENENEANLESLGQAGAAVNKTIQFLLEKNCDEMAIASALLGGALGLLAHALDDAAIVRVLENAIASVKAGELRRITEIK